MQNMRTIDFPFDLTAELDFQFKWVRWCAGASTNLSAYTPSCDPGLEITRHSREGNIVTIWARLNQSSPAPEWSRPQVHCDIVTVDGHRDRRSCELRIMPR